RGRGAGTVRDGVAVADAALPEPVDDGGGRRRADRRAGRYLVVGGGPRTLCGATLAARRADRVLPHPGRDHGAGRAVARRDRSHAAVAAGGARDRGTAVDGRGDPAGTA